MGLDTTVKSNRQITKIADNSEAPIRYKKSALDGKNAETVGHAGVADRFRSRTTTV